VGRSKTPSVTGFTALLIVAVILGFELVELLISL
jgi:hypothetical protein